MVNTGGQLYTIEGIAASLLIVTTAYLVISTTIVFTPGETHIYDMQLEQLGTDVLAAMDANETWTSGYSLTFPKSPLEQYVEENNSASFQDSFLSYCNTTTGSRMDDLNYNATIFFRNSTGVYSKHFAGSDYYRENAVKVTRWVNIDNSGSAHPELDPVNQTVLLEVLLWRE